MESNLISSGSNNSFKTLEEARLFAKNNKGNEAIVRNEDKTYSILQLDNEQNSAKKIIEEANSPDLVFKIVELNIDGKIEEIKPVNQTDNEINNISEKINNNSFTINSFEKIRNDINSIIGNKDDILKTDLNSIQSSYNELIGNIEKGSVKVSNEEKNTILSLGKTISKLKDLKQEKTEALKIYNNAVKESADAAKKLSERLDVILSKAPNERDKKLVKSIFENVLSDYTQALSTNNQENIILASLYINKFIELCNGKAFSLSQASNLTSNFNQAAEILNTFHTEGTLNGNHEYDLYDSFFEAIKSFIPKDSEESKFFETLFNENKEIEDVKEISKPESSEIKSFPSMAKEQTKDLSIQNVPVPPIDEIENKSAKEVKSEHKLNNLKPEVKFIDVENTTKEDKLKVETKDKTLIPNETESKVSNNINKNKPEVALIRIRSKENIKETYDQKIQNTFDMVRHDFATAAKSLSKSNSNLISASRKNIEISHKEKNIKSEFKQFDIKLNYFVNNRKEIIRAFISSIDKNISERKKLDEINNKINLNLKQIISNPSNDSNTNHKKISESMKELSSEISDKEKKLLKEKLAAKLLDQKYAQYIKDNEERLKVLEFSKNEMEKLFIESNEVREAKMSFKLKELRFDDILSKIALISLNSDY